MAQKIQLETEVDPSGSRRGFDQIKQDAHVMAREVAQAGTEAGAGLQKIGDGSVAAATKVERETRSMAASIQRATAAAEAGGRGTAAYYEAIAKQRGVSADALKPYIDQLRAAEAASMKAAGAVGTIGVSAAQTAAALRGVPAQFTDIVTSIASGQAPLTVFLQQGGQLKDMFGGAGNAARALGGYVSGLINPFTLAAGAVLAVGAGYAVGAQEATEFSRTLILTGNQAGTTAGALMDMAAGISSLGAGTQGRAAEVLNAIATSGGVGAVNLQRFAAAAIELERAGGPAAEKTAEAFAALARAPLAGALKLNEATGFLTRSTYEQIKALEGQGRTTEAARAAQIAYAEAIEQRAPAVLGQLGLIERAWLRIKDGAKGALDGVLNIGRASTAGDQLAGAQRELARLEAARSTDRNSGRSQSTYDAQIEAAREVVRQVSRRLLVEGEVATAQAEQVRQVKALAEFDKAGTGLLDKRQRVERDILEARNLGTAAGLTSLEIETRVAAIRAAAVDKSGKSDAAREAEQQVRLFNELSGLTSSYTEDVTRLNAARASGNIDQERYGVLLAELLSRQPVFKKATEEQAKATKEEADATAAAVRERERYLGTLRKDVDSGERSLEQLRDELLLLTAGKEAVRARVALRIEEQIQQLDLQAIRQADRNLDEEASEALRERIRQLRQELELRRGIDNATDVEESRKAAQKAGEESLREWQRINDQIGQSLTDAIMSGGKSAGQLLRDYFRTLILRPIVEAAVKPVSQGINSLIGSVIGQPSYAGAGMAQGGIDYAQLASWAGSAYSKFFGAGAAAAANGASSPIAAYLTTGAVEGSTIGGAAAGGGAAGAAGGGSLATFASTWGAAIVAGIYKANSDYNEGFGREQARVAQNQVIGGRYGDYGLEAAVGKSFEFLGLSDKMVSLLSGATAVAKLIGRAAPQLRDTGVTGSFMGGDFGGQQFADWYAKGGLFRSSKRGTNYAPLDAEVSGVLDSGSKAMLAQIERYADVLGLPAERLAQITTQSRIVFTDDAEANQKAIVEAIASYGTALANSYANALAPMRKAGETVEQALQRLSVLQDFSENLNALGGVFSNVARLGISARESFIEMAGGMDALQQQAQGFVQNYYGRDEIAGLKARDLQEVLRGVGITGDISTKDQFRALVDTTDVSTAAGQERLASLLQASQEFAQIAEYLAETGNTLASAAAQSPQSPVLEKLFQGDGQMQIEAINGVTSAVGASGAGIVAAIERLVEIVSIPNYGPSFEVGNYGGDGGG